MSNDFPDVHHKLCKKAAHLTAAFYYLNLKNDENNLILQTTIQAYEKEMDNILKIANDMLDKHIKDNPQYRQVKEISAAYIQFKQDVDQEKKDAIQEFKDYKKAVEDREKQREEDIGIMIQSYEEEIDNIKEKLKNLEGLFESQINGKDLEREKEKSLLEDLEAKDKEIEKLKEKNEELESLIEELKGKNKSLKEIENANSLENGNLMNDLKSQLKNMQKEVEGSKKSLKEREDDFEARIKKMKKEHQEAVDKISKDHNGNVKKMKDEFEKEKKAKDERITVLEEKLKKSEELLEKLRLESLSKEKEEQLLQEIQRLNNLLEETKKSFNEKLDLQNKRSEETRLRILQESKVDKEKSLQILREELTDERRVMEAEKDGKIKELEDQLRVFLEGPSADDLAAEYQNKINALSQRHNNQVRELIERNDEKVDSMTKHYEKELNEVSHALEREKENVLKKRDEEKNNEIGNLKKEYESKLQKISRNFDQKLQEKTHELAMKLNDRDDEVANLKEEVEYLREQLREAIDKLEQKENQCRELHGSKIHRSSSLKSSQVVEQTKSLFDMMGLNLKDLLRKFKEEDFMDKGKEEIINDHLVFAEKIDRFFTALQRQHEEKIQMMMDQYNELMAAFRSRQSKSEGLSIIRQLQEENVEREEEIKRIGEGTKTFLPEMHHRETKSYTKGFTSQTALGAAANLTLQTEKGKKSQKVLVAPITTTSSSTLPPISVTQSTLNQRGSQLNHGFMQPKKLFK